jgi:hypothetical protein
MADRKVKLPSGTWIEREMYLSKAFWSLTGAASQLLILFLGKRKRDHIKDHKGNKSYNWINLNNITMTYKELENLWYHPLKTYLPGEAKGITQPRITRAIDELLAKGFIEIVKPGGAYKQDKAVYGLIDKWKTWKKGDVYSKRPLDAHRGWQGKPGKYLEENI